MGWLTEQGRFSHQTDAIEAAVDSIDDGDSVWLHAPDCGRTDCWPDHPGEGACDFARLEVGVHVFHSPQNGCTACAERRRIDSPPPWA